MARRKHFIGMSKAQGTGASRTLKSRKTEAYRMLRRKGWSDIGAKEVLNIDFPIPAVRQRKHYAGHKHGIVGAAIAEMKRERILEARKAA